MDKLTLSHNYELLYTSYSGCETIDLYEMDVVIQDFWEDSHDDLNVLGWSHEIIMKFGLGQVDKMMLSAVFNH
jgi:hypothetical protein